MKYTSLVSLIVVSFFAVSSLQAQKEVTNADLLRKLEEIQGKIENLEKRVASIEAKSNAATAPVALPQANEDRESFLKRLRAELTTSAVRESGPWTDAKSWEGMRKGLTPSQVRGLLGRPHKQKLSINPRISDVWIYEGDLNADGKSERGTVNFSNGRVLSIEKP